jgi:hypothetical protein
MSKEVKKSVKPEYSYRKVVVFSLLSAVLLLITNSAYWINNQIFNSDNFTNTVTTSLSSESSRDAISEQISNRIYAENPIAQRVAGDFTAKVVSGLLNTNQFENILTTAVEKLQVYATSSNQESVAIDLSGVKDVVSQLTRVSENLGRDVSFETENIPDEIVILNEEDVPDLYKVGVVFLWLAPISLLGAIILLAYPYTKKYYNRKKILLIQGMIVTATGFSALLLGPLFKPPILSAINEPNNRIVVGNMYDAFINTFNQQTIYLAYVGVIAVIVSLIWFNLPYIKSKFTKI